MTKPIAIGLSAVILAVTDEEPRVLTVEHLPSTSLPSAPSTPEEEHAPALPFAPLDPIGHRTLELGLRDHVLSQTGMELGYVEQLYTFGDRDRLYGYDEHTPRLISVAYLALVQETRALLQDAHWVGCYRFFPWEDWRNGTPPILEDTIYPAVREWVENADSPEEQTQRQERAAITFGWGQAPWDGYRVLERYELLYEMGLIPEAQRDEGAGNTVFPLGQQTKSKSATREKQRDSLGSPMALDHRRILSTALGRLRGKIKYRPVVFELLPDTFTLLRLQRVVEALAGLQLHKQNFRRLIERGGLVEGSGKLDTQTGGRPAKLFRFRREVLRERPTSGVGLPGTPTHRRN